jgi:hypothetical protein
MVYNLGEMFGKRKRKNKTVHGAQPDSPPAVLAPDSSISSPITVGVYRETKTPPLLTDAFKGAIEKAADRARSELASQGKIKPTAFFVHADGTMKMVSLSLRDGYQKEALIRRIREKAFAENAFAVIVMTEIDYERHGVVLSGITLGVRASARVDYSFDKETKTVTSWKMSWLDKPVQNVFLDGIFDKTG